MEQGTTTTPFDMVVMNGMSRFHLCIEALRRSERFANRAPELIEQFKKRIADAVAYSMKYLKDMPEIQDWVWTDV
jgi:xylulose-5-phosphate/fructose-6-phosphate phosphoketolase